MPTIKTGSRASTKLSLSHFHLRSKSAVQAHKLTMAANTSLKKYKRGLAEAQALMNREDFPGCVEKAKYNLMDDSLPAYYQMLNCILLVSASDDWEDADHYLRGVEITWVNTYEDAVKKKDEFSLGILKKLRAQLDELLADREEDYRAMAGSEGEQEQEEPDLFSCKDVQDSKAFHIRRVNKMEEDLADAEDAEDQDEALLIGLTLRTKGSAHSASPSTQAEDTTFAGFGTAGS